MKEQTEKKDELQKISLSDAELLLEKEMDEVLGGDYDCYCQGSPAGQPAR